MKKTFLSLAAVLLAVPLQADEQTQRAQLELKAQGFYYGEVDGNHSTETTAAIRRYQIRNGQEVTGTLSPETAEALGLNRASTPPRVPQENPPPAPPPSTPKSVQKSDQEFLRREESKAQPPTPPPPVLQPVPGPNAPRYEPRDQDPSIVRPPIPLEAPEPENPLLPDLFENTPYENAPYEVQASTLRRAQSVLAGKGFYRDIIDGRPGPATEEALLAYQHRARLPLTGRLDLETLSTLNLLPGRTSNSRGGFNPPAETSSRKVFRGIWVR